MLVTGKTRLLSVTALVILGFIAIVALSYNPSFTDDSSSYLRKWAKISHEQAPAWLLQGEKDPAGAQEALGDHPESPNTEDLSSQNPNPAAALDEAKEALSSGEHDKNGPAAAEPPAVNAEEKERLAVLAHLHTPVDWDEVKKKWHQIFAQGTKSKDYFHINFGEGVHAINPNLIPHPRLDNTWVVMAQEFVKQKPWFSGWCAELVCDAQFDKGGNLTCIAPPKYATIPPTQSNNCPPELPFILFSIGPHDARMFWGPKQPYVIYGSQSHIGCFGQWTYDFRMLYDWGHHRNDADPFQNHTEIQRPPPMGNMEKNFFFFWDFDGVLYAHYDTHPKRVFAKLELDGTAGPDLAPLANPADEMCWAKHLELNPPPTDVKYSIHQSTNSISLTFCKSTDPTCIPGPDNTFIVQIFQHKISNMVADMHSRYEPFVMVFKQEAPFDMHAISSKPLWIHGRSSREELLYVTSLNWKSSERQYHGYLDDMLFLNFGIEDQSPASIDLSASDLVGELMLCKKTWKS